MCVELDWMDWIIMIMLPLDMCLVVLLLVGIFNEMFKRKINK